MTGPIPFKAFLYSQKLKADFSKLLSPPYDVIHPETHQALLSSHPYNSIRLSLVDDAEDPARYKKMKMTFESWKKEGVLEQHPNPAIYLIRDDFVVDGKARTRIGFVALLPLQKFGEGRVFPHEYTLAGPKKDRLALLEEMGAEASQIFFCYRDPQNIVEKLSKEYEGRPKYFYAEDASGVKRSLWIVDDEDDINEIQQGLSNCDYLIADGHHRYETALEYHRLHPDESSDFVQAYFTNSMSPGFGILPIHRLFQLPPSTTLEQIEHQFAKSGFEVEKIEPLQSLPALSSGANTSKLCFGIAFDGGRKALKISRERKSATESEIACVQSELFEGLLKWSPEELKKGLVQYEHTDQKFLEVLNQNSKTIGVYLPSCTYDQIMEVVKTGSRMPQKSTFFAPKLATGLVNYELKSAL